MGPCLYQWHADHKVDEKVRLNERVTREIGLETFNNCAKIVDWVRTSSGFLRQSALTVSFCFVLCYYLVGVCVVFFFGWCRSNYLIQRRKRNWISGTSRSNKKSENQQLIKSFQTLKKSNRDMEVVF